MEPRSQESHTRLVTTPRPDPRALRDDGGAAERQTPRALRTIFVGFRKLRNGRACGAASWDLAQLVNAVRCAAREPGGGPTRVGRERCWRCGRRCPVHASLRALSRALLVLLALLALVGCTSGGPSPTVEAPDAEPLATQRAPLTASVSFVLDGNDICPLCTGTGKGQYGSASRSFADPFPTGATPTSVTLTVHAVACNTGTVTFTLDGYPFASRGYVGGNCFCGAACLAIPRFLYVRPPGLQGWIAGGTNHFGIVDTDGQFVSFDATLDFSDEYALTPAKAPTVTSTLVTIHGAPAAALPGGTPVSVTFGWVAGSAIKRVDAETITALAPPHAAGAVDVVLVFPGTGDRMTFADAFAYEAPASTTTVLSSSANPSVSGQILTFTASVTPSEWPPAAGTVTFEDTTAGATLGSASLDGAGQASFATGALSVGTHAVRASYGGGNVYEASAGTLSQVVQRAQTITTLSSSANPVVAFGALTLTAHVAVTLPGSGAPSGIVTFREGTTTLGSAPLDAAGNAPLSLSTLPVGAHAIVAEWPGDAALAGSASGALTQTVALDTTTMTLTSTPNPSTYGAKVTFTATVLAASTGGVPTGTATFREGGTVLGTATLDATGKAAFETTTLGVGSHTITARYEGDAAHASATASLSQRVDAATTVLALVSAVDPSVFGQPVALTATVSGPGGTPSGTVTFQDGTSKLGSASLDAAGQATLTVASLSVGSHALSAVYSGDASFVGGATGTHAQVVNASGTTTTLSTSSDPSVVGAPVTFTASVAPIAPGAGSPTGTVTLLEGTEVLGSATLGAAGLATFSSTTFASFPAGVHALTARYEGETSFAASSSAALAQTVAKDVVTTALSSAPNPSVFGARVTFTATVTAGSTGGTPTGSVTFGEGSATLGVATLDATGGASFSTRAATGGTHAITATYSGDASHMGGSAGTVVQVVSVAGTTTSLSTSKSPTVRGEPVTLTATVAWPGDATLGTPTGTVELFDGTASLGTLSLGAGGVGGRSIASLSVASHAISARYAGDASFAPSTAPALVQEVDRAQTTVTLTSSSNPVLALSEVSFTAVVAAKAPGAGGPTGVVTFRETAPLARALGSGPLGSSGAAITSFSGLSVGSLEVVAEYGGDGEFEPSSSASWTQSVAANAASVTLTAAPAAPTFGDAVTLTASVRGAARVPTGGVSFSEGTATLGAATLDAAGVARLTMTTLAAGTRSLVATYGGDSAYGTATGATVVEVARATTLTTLTAPASARVGEVVALEVAVTSSAQGAGEPSGAVELFDGELSLGTRTLQGGKGTIAVATLALGTHALSARYAGDASFAGSASAVVTVEIAAAQANADGCGCGVLGARGAVQGAGAWVVLVAVVTGSARRRRANVRTSV